MTTSASAGTSRSCVKALVILSLFFPKKPANMYSSKLSGSGAIAENISSGGPPIQIATGILPSGHAAAWSAPCLCICQWRPTSFGPKT